MQAAQQLHSTLPSHSRGLHGFTKNTVISSQDEWAIFSACRFLNTGRILENRGRFHSPDQSGASPSDLSEVRTSLGVTAGICPT
jgi:hypothetical protein